jgi:TrmH family RNA methyltransferase
MLTSVQNPLVKQMRKLHRAKGRREQNLLLFEGTHLIETAYNTDCSLVTVCFTPQWQEAHPQLGENLSRRAQRLELVTPEVLKAIATTVNPDGIVATALRTQGQSSVIPNLNLGLVLERLQDPGNLGTIIRTAVATGVDGLWLSEDSVEIDNPKVLRSSAGAWFKLPMSVSPNLQGIVANYQQQGVQIVATLPKAEQTYWDIDFTRPTLILLGNEGAGLSEDLVLLSEQQVKIPLAPGVESLNVAIAAALLLYEAQRQKEV